MRCLLDENVHQGLVAWLTGLGHEAARSPKGLANGAVFAVAVTEGRVLITHDKDFAARPPASPHPGVILLRLVPKDLDQLTASLGALLTEKPSAELFADRLVVIFPDHHEEFPFRMEEFLFPPETG